MPTAIAGVYGMNFENIPELKIPGAYHIVVLAMLGVCGLLYRQFRRTGWL